MTLRERLRALALSAAPVRTRRWRAASLPPVTRTLRLALFLAAAMLLTLAVASPAGAAKRKVPFGFYGTVLNNSQSDRMSDAGLDAQMASMARSGVESVRYSVTWAAVERSRGSYDFRQIDRVVRAAARHRLDVLPIVLGTPVWASTNPSDPLRAPLYAPTDPQLYANFLTVLVNRYGPKGSFWASSGTPRVPIRNWQIWNEPAADFFWATRPWPSTYRRLLRAGYKAVHRADRGATVVLGSLTGVGGSTPWGQMRQIYKAGAKGLFDVVSVHFFSAATSARVTATQTLKVAKLLRREMRRGHDRKRKIWFTELTWTAAQGKIPRSKQLGFETTAKGQAARLRTVFPRLAKQRRKLGIGRAYWYAWGSEYVPRLTPFGPGSLTFQYAGLNRWDGTGDGFTALPILRTYAKTVSRYEGCRKSANARRCR
jgi:hypothetical protein